MKMGLRQCENKWKSNAMMMGLKAHRHKNPNSVNSVKSVGTETTMLGLEAS